MIVIVQTKLYENIAEFLLFFINNLFIFIPGYSDLANWFLPMTIDIISLNIKEIFW